jgi:RyR domain
VVVLFKVLHIFQEERLWLFIFDYSHYFVKKGPLRFIIEAVRLAKAEHEGWMRALLDDGWTYAPETDRAKKQHKLLVPWDELPEEEKEKDRDLVRGIPTILARAGYTVVKSSV